MVGETTLDYLEGFGNSNNFLKSAAVFPNFSLLTTKTGASTAMKQNVLG